VTLLGAVLVLVGGALCLVSGFPRGRQGQPNLFNGDRSVSGLEDRIDALPPNGYMLIPPGEHRLSRPVRLKRGQTIELGPDTVLRGAGGSTAIEIKGSSRVVIRGGLIE
jgi:hypothetical protein